MDTITRDNYEEHFLLYAEGELGPGERLEVEAFLRLNPDLRAELEAYDPSFRLPDIALRYRPRPLAWLRPLSIAASVALVVGVGIRLIHKDGELPSMPQPVEVAQVETPSWDDGLTSLSQPDRAEHQPVAESSRSASPRGQAVSPSSQIAHVVAETGHTLHEEAFAAPAPAFPDTLWHRSPAEPIYCAEAFPEEDPGPSHTSECNFDCSLLAELNINPLKIF